MTRLVKQVPVRVAWRLALASALLGAVLMGAGQAAAQQVEAFGVDRWVVYGTTSAHERAGDVPGQAAVTVAPRAGPGKPWSSGAGTSVPGAIVAGERVTAVFWARAARPTRLTVGLQGAAPDYARFAEAQVLLTTRWQQLSVSGTAPAAFAADSQSLSVPLGQAGAAVSLGPVAFLRGTADRAAVNRAFAAFRPTEVALDVRIPAQPDAMLAGTLHLPAGRDNGPFPLAVVIQGHGPNGRGGFPAVVRRLTTDGIAVLEYDKRGVGQSGGTYKEDMEQLTADAGAAVAAMLRRSEIDGKRVALVGQSQGGVIAPALAAADPTIAAVVTLAGSVGDGLPYIRRALGSQLIASGLPAAAVAAPVDAVMALLQARIDGNDAAKIASLRTAVVERFQAIGFSREQAESALAMIDTEEAWSAPRLRSASDLAALHVPVLAVFGSKDPLVIATDEAPAARAALANNPRAEVVILDGLSHWFQERAVTGREDEVAKLGPNVGSPRVVELVGDWLRNALAPTGGASRQVR